MTMFVVLTLVMLASIVGATIKQEWSGVFGWLCAVLWYWMFQYQVHPQYFAF